MEYSIIVFFQNKNSINHQMHVYITIHFRSYSKQGNNLTYISR